MTKHKDNFRPLHGSQHLFQMHTFHIKSQCSEMHNKALTPHVLLLVHPSMLFVLATCDFKIQRKMTCEGSVSIHSLEHLV